MTIEHCKDRFRFGMVAVEKGFINEKQLVEAMKIQVGNDIKGTGHKLIGTILFEEGYMNAKEVDGVLRCMEMSTKNSMGSVM